MSKQFLYFLFIFYLGFLMGCEKRMTEQEVIRIGLMKPQRLAPYIYNTNLDVSRIALSTSEPTVTGLALVQVQKSLSDTTKRKIWQHPSWIAMGAMGSLTSDENGNAYTAPIPLINTIGRSLKTINRIYKIDPQTGELQLFFELPAPDSSAKVNAFGVIGLYFDNHGKKLYVSSIAGSSRDEEKGIIYVIDPAEKKIVDKLDGMDPFGLFVGGYTGEKRLYYGLGRTPDIYSIELTRSGKFKGSPQKEATLDQLGPRGNDKARRIRFDEMGNMIVYGVDFNYNLAAQTNKPETIYNFSYNPEEKKWTFTNIIK